MTPQALPPRRMARISGECIRIIESIRIVRDIHA
jgi:hypothetical protein